MPAAADILSALPDPLLGLILSKIPIGEAVRCSVLSKRWRFLYTQIPQLTLSPILLLPNVNPYQDPLSVARVEKIISNLLLSHSSDIEAFHLFNNFNPYDCLQFTRESEWQWVRYAASKDVQHLTLCDSPDIYCDSCTPVREIPPAIFSCTRLTTLRLSHYKLTNLPSHFSGFKHLIACSFKDTEFTDNSLSTFISHSPFLQTLTLRFYAGLRKPVIFAPNLTHLFMYGRSCFYIQGKLEVLTLNCLKLRKLEMESSSIDDLRINGVLFHELSSFVSKIKMQCGSNVTELWLDLAYPGTLQVSVERVVEIVGGFKTLKKLDINRRLGSQNQMVVLVDNLLERLPGLARLRELVRDPILPCVTSLLGNLRKVKVRIYLFDKGEITILDKLLESACALEIMEVELPYLSKGQSACGTASSGKKKANAFLTKLLYLSGSASTRARICVSFQYYE